ncbi:MAG TPA: DUF2249 domain-containing protein [Chitinophagaceae bacterium]|nr:DUF2249 domain-containing protein [Chitinophagaceae bacterium]
MMTINAQTKIKAILKHNPGALDAIVSIHPRFEKLRNPVLRKLMAGRASISMAAKIAGCTVQDFFTRLEPLGFRVDAIKDSRLTNEEKELPIFLKNIEPTKIINLDVRPVLEAGEDPLQLILEKFRSLVPGQVLVITNSFEPVPLMKLVKKQGFESYADHIHDNLVLTYFYKADQGLEPPIQAAEAGALGFDELMQQYQGKLLELDVRQLQMPLPMQKILEALDELPVGRALFVYHKRVPVFLLPELVDRKLDYRIKEIREGEVHLIIFKP